MDSLEEGNHVTLNELVDIIDEEDELAQNADAVLGGSDDRNCTYLMGYVPRQALYACKTCYGKFENEECAGVCLACSLECHDGHELFELYTKRNFRCDCGNKKFPEGFTCKLCPKKLDCNEGNVYNQNFKGFYCICRKPYPDPDDPVEDEMIQCMACEDWFHGRHLIPKNVESQDYDEMVCSSCMKKNSFLWKYAKLCKGIFEKQDLQEGNADSDVNIVSEADKVNVRSEEIDCKVHQLSEVVAHADSSVFFPSDWRKQLCLCINCRRLYSENGVEFLVSEGDSIAEYEEKGKANSSKSFYDAQVSNLNHVQKVELVRGFMDLKSGLTDYLKKFAESGKVVREEDIAEFFTGLQARKKQRTDSYNNV